MNQLLFRLITLCALMALSLWGQSLSSLNGTVSDPTGAVVPGATVVLENIERGIRRETVSDAAGRYTFPQVQPDQYRLTAKAQGFADVIVNDVRLLVNTPATVNIAFEKVGAIAEAISVTAEAAQVNTTDASLGNAVGTTAITQLPFEARNVVRLLSLQPGVVFLGEPPTVAGTEDSRSGAVNGGKSDQANVTLDGVDVNDQQERRAFTSVLRVTLDSVQEFRVTTLNPNADQGRSSGAQVALVTKSGTNEMHGSLYEYHRNTVTTANSFFNNSSGVPRQKLLRNVFGASVGGPLKKNRLFYFLNYEGRRDASESSVVRTVPTESMRQGIVQYRRTDGSVGTLTPQDIRTRIDPTGVGPSSAALEFFRSYPVPNDSTAGDGLNTLGYRFKAPIGVKQDTYIARLDYLLDAAGTHNLFWRGNLQNDRDNTLPQFPGLPANNVGLNNSKGFALGYNSVLRPNLIGTTRYGFTRQGVETTGLQNSAYVSFRNLSNRYGQTAGTTRIIPVHNLSQDFTWTRGAHNVQFGGTLRWIRNSRSNTANSFHFASMNSSWLARTGAGLQTGVTDVASTFRTAYRDTMMSVLGLISQVDARYNYLVDGTVLPMGAPVLRKFAMEEYEVYAQDTWRLSRGLTVTAGLRYSLMPPIYEANGQQISAQPSIGDWFNLRGRLAGEGKSQGDAGKIQYVAANSAQGRGLYAYHKKNFGPRLSLAYSPQSTGGWKQWLFGGPGKTSIRAGWGMYYDLFGQSIIRTFDSSALGLSTRITNPAGLLDVGTAPRFTSFFSMPTQLIPAAPKGGFPQVAPDQFAITGGFDDTLKPPYNMSMNFTIGREFRGGIYVQGSYVGRLSRRSLIQRDLAAPTDLKDPASGMTYFQAAQAMTKLVDQNVPVSQVQKMPYWENLWGKAAGGGLSATQVIYQAFQLAGPDTTSALQLFDDGNLCSADGTSAVDSKGNVQEWGCSKFGPYAMFNSQYSALSGWSSIAGGSYHAMQWTARKRFSHGLQFDFNYTWSKSIDLGSDTERVADFGGGYNWGFVTNPWAPGQRKAVSDYDTTHAWSASWIAELPVGRNKRFGHDMNRALDALAGGWQLTGVWRQTSGLVNSVDNGRVYPTSWDLPGFATQVGVVPAPQTTKNAPAVSGNGGPNVFSDPKTALAAYNFTLPGESGQRNGIRGDGYFTIDLGLAKRFVMPYSDRHSIQFRWETFNVPNTARFDIKSASLNLGSTATFGKYSRTLTEPRVMQFSLRYEF